MDPKAAKRLVGAHVELHPGCDLWMRGARFGTISRVDGDHILVRMDHPQVRELQRFTADRLRFDAFGLGTGAEYGLGLKVTS